MHSSLIQLFPQPGLLHAYLLENTNPRICWYPSSSTRDYRDMLYLHPRYREFNAAFGDEPPAPDLFIHTDVQSPESHSERPPLEEYNDAKTQVIIREWEELPRLDLPKHEEVVYSHPDLAAGDGRAYFMWVEVSSHRFGVFSYPLIYICCENSAFCARVLLRHGIRVTHVLQCRYGHGMGGAYWGPGWIAPLLPRLGTEVFVSDDRWCEHHPRGMDDKCGILFQHFPELWAPLEERPELVKLPRPLQGLQGYSQVTWYLPRTRAATNCEE